VKLFTWLMRLFSSVSSNSVAIAEKVNSLVPMAFAVVEQVEKLKQRYKDAEDLARKNGVILEYVSENERDLNTAVKVANQLLYCPSAAMWTELAVMGVRTVYPQAPGTFIRIAVPMAYAMFVESKSSAEVTK
jgi:hypothetical protein